jgi:hypothetical protein
MATDRFRRNNHSNVFTKVLDLSAQLPLAPGDTLYSEEIPAGAMARRGFNFFLNDANAQANIKILAAYEKHPPRKYNPVFHSLLQTPLDFSVSSGANPGIVSFSEEFIGDWIQFSIQNTGLVPITDIELIALLSGDMDFS